MKAITDFKINTNNPRTNSVYDSNDSKLSEAIYTTYPMDTEDATLYWENEEISLSYRYDISIIIDELVNMMLVLCLNDSGQLCVVWSSDTFFGEWELTWSGQSLEICANWFEWFHASEYLTKHNRLEIDKIEYLIEWQHITDKLLQELAACGYNYDNLDDWQLLFEANAMVGELYNLKV